MRVVDTKLISQLQSHPKRVRNICILAHVDHGKTTLADSLVASNGIISSRMAGKLRYMDSRKDEQIRGITMKSSAIALAHSFGNDLYLVNLIDSPGHVDFSTEVSTAVRLCDGAIVVVDVVEGVCPQTKVALQQAWLENIKPVLVLNKIDRLILELKLEPLDAYVKLTQVLEQVNAVMGEFFTSDVMAKSDQVAAEKIETDNAETKETYDWSAGLEDADDDNLYFSPEAGNVVFASAYDGWAFQVKDFAKIYAEKLGINEVVLNKTLWGDYYLNAKIKRIIKGAQVKAKKPLFVQFVLENLWSLYDVIAVRRDKDKLEKILASLNVKILPRDLRSTDIKVHLQAVCSSWLPLSQAVLDMVCDKLPSPAPLTADVAERLMCSHNERFDSLPPDTQALRQAFINCSSDVIAPTIVFISKMFPVERKMLPENKTRQLTSEEMAERRKLALEKLAAERSGPNAVEKVEEKTEEPKEVDEAEDVFIAFARVYSGTLRRGQDLYVLGPKYDPRTDKANISNINPSVTLRNLKADQHVTRVCVGQLYLLMGRDLLPLDHVPAGSVVGIGGLSEHVLKTATLSDSLACPSFAEIRHMVTPILRVAVEPTQPHDMQALVRGLKLLNQADPAVEVRVQETGEHVILTVGEVHLQRCLEDLRERYAKVAINVSEPIVPFRETIVPPPLVDMVNEAIEGQTAAQSKESNEKELIVLTTPNKQSRILLRAAPLPQAVVALLEKSADLIRAMCDRSYDAAAELATMHISGQEISEKTEKHSLTDRTQQAIAQFKEDLEIAFDEAGAQWNGFVAKIWCFGPRRCGPNILFNNTPYKRSFWEPPITEKDKLQAMYDSSFVSGFQLATLAGPLCEEPMTGVAFIVEDWEVLPEAPMSSGSYGPLSGQIVSTVKDGCRKAFQAQAQRLMLAMYSCSIQVNAEMLGKMYAVLGRRHGRVLHGDMTQGTATFSVTAVLPVIESVCFAPEMRKQTSGLANPQLVFSHWEILDEDPFWVPRTEEEYLHFGEKADSVNRARQYMDSVRRRKGLCVEEKVVEFAEKQRTLGKNK